MDGKFVAAKSSVKTIGLEGQGPWSVTLSEMDEQLDVEGLIEGGHQLQGRAERGPVEGLEACLGVEHVGQ